MKILLLTILLSTAAAAQSAQTVQDSTAPAPKKQKAKKGAGGDIGSGAANIGGGAAKGAASAAKGAAKGAVDLATLHPIDAGTAVGGSAFSRKRCDCRYREGRRQDHSRRGQSF